MKVIIVGSNGQLGQCIKDQIKQMNVTDEYILYSKSELDISKFNDVERIIEDVIPNMLLMHLVLQMLMRQRITWQMQIISTTYQLKI